MLGGLRCALESPVVVLARHRVQPHKPMDLTQLKRLQKCSRWTSNHPRPQIDVGLMNQSCGIQTSQHFGASVELGH